jgi:large-conductance mechanosensitive channel
MGWVWKLLGAALAIWVVFLVAGALVATLKTFLIIGLIAVAVFIVVSLIARRRRDQPKRRGSDG